MAHDPKKLPVGTGLPKMFSLDEVPPIKGRNFTGRTTVALSARQIRGLKTVREVHKKDSSQLIRMLIDWFLDANGL